MTTPETRDERDREGERGRREADSCTIFVRGAVAGAMMIDRDAPPSAIESSARLSFLREPRLQTLCFVV